MNLLADFPAATAQPDLEYLLAPLSPDAPCGPAPRYDPVFTDIRLLREEDDPGLPMGQWERPLKRADWDGIEQRCTAMLTTRSKDLQLAAWLAESWLRRHGLDGLARGLRLIDALLRRYWTPLHPVIEDDGDTDARLAPLEWLNQSLSDSVRVHAVLLTLDDDKVVHITLADWDGMALSASAPPPAKPVPGAPPPRTRADIAAGAGAHQADVAAMQRAVVRGLDSLHAIVGVLDHHLGDDGPKLHKLQGVLEAVQRLLSQWQPQAGDTALIGVTMGQAPETLGDAAALPPIAADSSPASPIVLQHWRNRNEAYATLATLADYLAEVEPHSPTPFLIRRAVKWGRMSLAEVMVEIIEEEGDLSRLLNILGVKPA